MKAFIVDDNELDRIFMEALLSKLDIPSMSFKSGHDFLFDAAKVDFDLGLVDLMMPNMSGLELIRSFRKSHRSKDSHLIVISGSSDAGDIRRAIAAGANDYIVKPVDEEVFREKVRPHILSGVETGFVEYTINGNSEDKEAVLWLDAELLSISELGVQCILPKGEYIAGSNIQIEFSLFNRLGLHDLIFQIIKVSQREGHLIGELRYVGIIEKHRRQIRRCCNQLHRDASVFRSRKLVKV